MMHQPVDAVFEDLTDEEPGIFQAEIDGTDMSFVTNLTDEQVVEMLWAFLTKDETRH